MNEKPHKLTSEFVRVAVNNVIINRMFDDIWNGLVLQEEEENIKMYFRMQILIFQRSINIDIYVVT